MRIQSSDKVYYFSVNFPYSQCEALYSGNYPNVVLTADSGQTIQVPSNRIRPFISSAGLVGQFRMIVDENNKIKSFERLR